MGVASGVVRIRADRSDCQIPQLGGCRNTESANLQLGSSVAGLTKACLRIASSEDSND